MYSLTVHIAPKGTVYINQIDGKQTESAFGHMWYSISGPGGTYSHGFGSVPNATYPPRSAGDPKLDDLTAYQGNHAVKTVQITEAQFNVLRDFGDQPQAYRFPMDYRDLA